MTLNDQDKRFGLDIIYQLSPESIIEIENFVITCMTENNGYTIKEALLSMAEGIKSLNIKVEQLYVQAALAQEKFKTVESLQANYQTLQDDIGSIKTFGKTLLMILGVLGSALTLFTVAFPWITDNLVDERIEKNPIIKTIQKQIEKHDDHLRKIDKSLPSK